MSLSTRCPSCDTQFRLVPDQLKISHGWVRCGHCAEVFDASQRLIEIDDEAPLAATSSADAASSNAIKNIANNVENTPAIGQFSPNTSATDHLATQPMGLSPEAPAGNPDAHQSPHSGAALQPDFAPQPGRQDSALTSPVPLEELSANSGTSEDLARELEALAARSNASSGWGKGQTNSRFDVESVLVWSTSRPDLQAEDEVPFGPSKPTDADDALNTVSFVRQARRQAFWRHPGVRALLLLLCLGMGAVLAAQWAQHDRNRLALTQPQLQPYIAQLCALTGCRIEPLQRIEAIAIDSSSFSKARSDAQQEIYRLSFVIKNNAALPIALPALELTLTDTQDSPVLRRSLLPSDWGARGSTAPAGGELNASVAIAIPVSLSSASAGLTPGRVSGYRLLAYYP
jgi:predicted Zn finger-like uncharacterized protein